MQMWLPICMHSSMHPFKKMVFIKKLRHRCLEVIWCMNSNLRTYFICFYIVEKLVCSCQHFFDQMYLMSRRWWILRRFAKPNKGWLRLLRNRRYVLWTLHICIWIYAHVSMWLFCIYSCELPRLYACLLNEKSWKKHSFLVMNACVHTVSFYLIYSRS